LLRGNFKLPRVRLELETTSSTHVKQCAIAARFGFDFEISGRERYDFCKPWEWICDRGDAHYGSS
jgi:hypothetical protein